MIPARSGSQGLKGKNVLSLANKPIIAYSITPAIDCELVDEVYLNSDSVGYLRIGEQFGAKGYRRPAALATNNSSMQLVVKDFCEYIKKTDKEVDCVVVLYPTYPFRSASNIEDFIRKFRAIGRQRNIVGLKEPDTHPCLIYNRTGGGNLEQYSHELCAGMFRRQEYPAVYELTHWICVVPIDGIADLNDQMINDRTYGYLLGKDANTLNIDAVDDYLYAQFLLDKTEIIK